MSRVTVLRETHETPAAVTERLLRAGGRNRFGEANYRVVWGWNRLTWIGGRWEDWGEDGRLIREVVALRYVPKYATALNRWHVERWVPPEIYGSPEKWYRQTIEREDGIAIPALGPYPSRGEYELAFTLESEQGGFVQLTATLAEEIARAIEYGRRFPRSARRAAIYRREEKRSAEYREWAMEVLQESGKAFYGQPFITVPHSASPPRRASSG